MNRNETLIAILKDQVVPALGCTEPGAVAYAVARAKGLLGTKVDSMVVYVDKNVLKNGLGVGIPGTPERGIVFACALALEIGKSEYKLEVLKGVLGSEKLCSEICRAIGSYEAEEVLSYIMRVWDVDDDEPND